MFLALVGVRYLKREFAYCGCCRRGRFIRSTQRQQRSRKDAANKRDAVSNISKHCPEKKQQQQQQQEEWEKRNFSISTERERERAGRHFVFTRRRSTETSSPWKMQDARQTSKETHADVAVVAAAVATAPVETPVCKSRLGVSLLLLLLSKFPFDRLSLAPRWMFVFNFAAK